MVLVEYIFNFRSVYRIKNLRQCCLNPKSTIIPGNHLLSAKLITDEWLKLSVGIHLEFTTSSSCQLFYFFTDIDLNVTYSRECLRFVPVALSPNEHLKAYKLYKNHQNGI